MKRHLSCNRMIAVGLLLTLLGACEQEPARPVNPPAATQAADLVELPADKATYAFAPGLSEKHPEVVAFMRHFLETCLAGDYSGYRDLVTRRATPESRARFKRVLHALRRLQVEDIRTVDIAEMPDPTYVISAKATFRADIRDPRGRMRDPRSVAMLIFQEDGHWRTALAPPELQPMREQPTAPEEPPPTSAPSYPWDEYGDY